MGCDHSALRSGGARYLPATGELQLMLVCDSCGGECQSLGRVDYRLRPRRLTGHLAELTARELGLDQARVARVASPHWCAGSAATRSRRRSLPSAGRWTSGVVEVRRHPELGAALLVEGTSRTFASGSCATVSALTAPAIRAGCAASRYPWRHASSPSPTPTRRSSASAPTARRAATTRPATSCCGARAHSSTPPSSARF